MFRLNCVDIGVDFNWKGAISLPVCVPAAWWLCAQHLPGELQVFCLIIMSRKFKIPLVFEFFFITLISLVKLTEVFSK